jgi:phenylalanyl-tRNA synthetase beta subunit
MRMMMAAPAPDPPSQPEDNTTIDLHEAVSLTFALRFRAPDRTLTQAEATEAKQAGVALAAERFGAAIRD